MPEVSIRGRGPDGDAFRPQFLQLREISRGQSGYHSDARAKATCGDRAIVDSAAWSCFLCAVHDDTVDGEVAEHQEVEKAAVGSASARVTTVHSGST